MSKIINRKYLSKTIFNHQRFNTRRTPENGKINAKEMKLNNKDDVNTSIYIYYNGVFL